MIYNQSRTSIKERGRIGKRVISETDSTTTVRVLDLFNIVCLKTDQAITPSLKFDGYLESAVTSWLTRWLRPGMTFVDIGANCGYYTMLAEKLVSPYGAVVAYEPNPVNAELLRATRAINHANFSVRQVALSDRCGTAILSVPGEYVTNYEVLKTTLDNECQRLVFWNHDVIKIAAGSAEQLIWNGGQTILTADSSMTTLLLEYDPHTYTNEFLNELFKWGNVSYIAFDGGEIPLTRESVDYLSVWNKLVIRRK